MGVTDDRRAIMMNAQHTETETGDIASFQTNMVGKLDRVTIANAQIGDEVKIFHTGRNLIPDGTNTHNGYVDGKYPTDVYDTHQEYLQENTNYYTSEYFVVKPNSNYVFSIEGKVPLAPAISFFDKNMNYIRVERFLNVSPKFVTTPANAAYARSAQRKTGGSIQFEPGSTAHPYEAYHGETYQGTVQSQGTVETPIRTYVGDNNVWSDASGDITVNYWKH